MLLYRDNHRQNSQRLSHLSVRWHWQNVMCFGVFSSYLNSFDKSAKESIAFNDVGLLKEAFQVSGISLYSFGIYVFGYARDFFG
jgi:hypothetical protein